MVNNVVFDVKGAKDKRFLGVQRVKFNRNKQNNVDLVSTSPFRIFTNITICGKITPITTKDCKAVLKIFFENVKISKQ